MSDPAPSDPPVAPAAASSEAPRKRRRLLPAPIWHVGKLLVLALIVEYLVLPQLAGTRKSLHLVSQVKPIYLLLGVVLEAAALVAYSEMTRTVLPEESNPGLFTILRIQLTTLSVSHCVPAGSAAGSSLGYRLLTLAGAGKADVGLAMGLQAVGSAVILNVIFLVALVVSIPVWGFSPLYVTTGIVGLILTVIFVVGVLLLTRGQRFSDAMIDRAARHIPFLDAAAAHAVSARFAVRLHELGADRRLTAKASFWATANWLLDAASLYVFVGAFGHWVNPDGLIVSFTIAHVLSVIPITPGGLGVVEATLTSTLVGFGTPRGIAILGVIGYRLVNFWLPIPVGGLAYLSLHIDPGHIVPPKRGFRLRRASAASGPPSEEAAPPGPTR